MAINSLREAVSVKCNKSKQYLTAAEVLAMRDVGVLSQWLGQSVCNLVVCTDRKDLDETLPNVLTKVMIAHVDVLGPWPKFRFRQTSKFQGTRVVLEDLAIDDWLFAHHFVAAIAHLVC
jgi:hypothetical protein